ncbi:NAD(P)H-dependent oxidoreductase [Mangrovivirga sp. M17]|uniref:NAD(P)H-dependent oxidoreductase n=1 Tax=Mangrovivirga halotolerans TaxID=2993936 RepID=A0ABT3RRD0_9BACT|nr:NAD(P)H-dependent oxidoreductase [Mangrovivirga halotolerans]MCX2744123.1 NAD(P)H-dependent oxidoreductase [Mangrovivirga halotolerans]
MKRIVAFAGSNSSKSINMQLVNYVLSQLDSDQYEIERLDLNDFEMPIYSIDREKEHGIPEKAHQFREHFSNSDAIICSMAEHNNSYTVAFKNILDWSSRIDLNIFAGKKMLLMSASPGGYGGGNVMKAASSFFPKCDAEVVDTFSLPKFYNNFKDGKITNEEFDSELKNKIKGFENSLHE